MLTWNRRDSTPLSAAPRQFLFFFSPRISFQIKKEVIIPITFFYSFEFFMWALADGFHWSLSDSKSPQVSRTLFSILADLNNAVVWIVSTHLLISKSSSPCINPLMTLTSVPITIVITVTFMFHSFLVLLQGLGSYPSFNFLSVLLCSAGSLLLSIITRSGRLAGIRWSICITKSQKILYISLSRTDSGLCIYH